MLRKHILSIAILYTIALTYASLMRLRKLPDIGISFGDKIFHFLTYAVLAFLWAYTFSFRFKIERKKAIVFSAISSVVFGIIIEVVQGKFTVTRQTDVMDVLANTMGVIVIATILLFKNGNYKLKNNKDLLF